MGRKKGGVRLQVCMNNLLVGHLERAGTGAVSFQYSDSWIQHEGAMPISTSLPLRSEKYIGKEAYNYFENLLPDSPTVRKKIAQRVGAQSAELVDLLGIIGRDCIGALQFLPEESDLLHLLPDVAGEMLTNKRIETMLNNLSSSPLGLEENTDFRISIAGAQEKTALLKIESKWFLPTGSVPTSHIFKKSMGQLANGIDMTQSVFNEWLCLSICKKLGLEVASAEVLKFGQTHALVVERFDRRWSKDGKRLYRIPIEDLCQALGINTSVKYEREGGAGIKAIMALLNTSNFREKDRRTFIKAQIVFHLLGAIDGHAKNFSIFLGPKGMHLTPIYDVLTAYPALKKRQIERKELKLAMTVGKNRQYRLVDIQRRHWYQTADLAGYNREQLDDIFGELEADLDQLTFQDKELPLDFPSQLFETTLEGLDLFRDQLFG